MCACALTLTLAVLCMSSVCRVTRHANLPLPPPSSPPLPQVLVGNTRKALTIVMSFVLFPKPVSPLYVLGGLFVFGGLTTIAYWKEKAHSAKERSKEAEGRV